MSLSLIEAVNLLKSKKWIDLTHAFNADSPYFFMFEPAEFKTLFDYRDGFFAQQFTFLASTAPILMHRAILWRDAASFTSWN